MNGSCWLSWSLDDVQLSLLEVTLKWSPTTSSTELLLPPPPSSSSFLLAPLVNLVSSQAQFSDDLLTWPNPESSRAV